MRAEKLGRIRALFLRCVFERGFSTYSSGGSNNLGHPLAVCCCMMMDDAGVGKAGARGREEEDLQGGDLVACDCCMLMTALVQPWHTQRQG